MSVRHLCESYYSRGDCNIYVVHTYTSTLAHNLGSVRAATGRDIDHMTKSHRVWSVTARRGSVRGQRVRTAIVSTMSQCKYTLFGLD